MEEQHRQLIEGLYRANYPALLLFAAARLESRELGEEAVQEVFRAACAKPEALAQSENPMGWLMEALKLEILRIRRQQKQLQLWLSSLTPEAVPEEEPESFLNDPKLTKDPDFRLLVQFAVEGRSQLELSRELGISLVACKKRIQRAKEKLRRKIEK